MDQHRTFINYCYRRKIFMGPIQYQVIWRKIQEINKNGEILAGHVAPKTGHACHPSRRPV